MRLLKLRLKRFRRFADEQVLDLNEDLIALVGPNEAGKSSILDALQILGGSRELGARDATRGSAGPVEIEGYFVLDDADRSAIADIKDGGAVRHCRVRIRSDRSPSAIIPEPRPMRDLEPRARCRERVRALDGDVNLDAQYSQSEHLRWDSQSYVDVVEILGSEKDSLSPEEISAVRELAERLGDLRPVDAGTPPEEASDAELKEHDRLRLEVEARAAARGAAIEALTGLAEVESEPAPTARVARLLRDRLPSVAVFEQGDRELASSYNFDEIVGNPPRPLQNLCTVAGIDLGAVQAARTAQDTGQVEKLFELGNDCLKEQYLAAWNQSKVYPKLGAPHQGVLQIWISTDGQASYSEPDERSDGLRWFIALHAFLMALGSETPILLVDEAETHLHYDAQTDLIDTLMREHRTAKVVYTTHSLGCLPPDLGRGIRAVLAERDTERSSIENSYWSIAPNGKRIGYTPVLFAMGANLLALTVPRYAVITEGPSDAVLLPTLLREVTGLDVLPYRIVPGLADLVVRETGALATSAGAVVCLTDGDPAGRKRLNAIRESAKVDPSCLFHLGQLREDEATLEDLVSEDVFLAAIRTEVETWAIQGLDLDDPPPTVGRWQWLRSRGSDSNDGPIADRLNKVRVAQRIVDQRRDSPTDAPELLVDQSVREPLLALHRDIVAALGIKED